MTGRVPGGGVGSGGEAVREATCHDHALDIDDTCDPVHGGQQLALFNARYETHCLLPIHIYDVSSGKPVVVFLREGKTPSGKGGGAGAQASGQEHPEAPAEDPHHLPGRFPLWLSGGYGVVRIQWN